MGDTKDEAVADLLRALNAWLSHNKRFHEKPACMWCELPEKQARAALDKARRQGIPLPPPMDERSLV